MCVILGVAAWAMACLQRSEVNPVQLVFPSLLCGFWGSHSSHSSYFASYYYFLFDLISWSIWDLFPPLFSFFLSSILSSFLSILSSFLPFSFLFKERQVIMRPACLRTKYIAEGDLELMILLPLPLKCDYRPEQQSSALCSAGIQVFSNDCQAV